MSQKESSPALQNEEPTKQLIDSTFETIEGHLKRMIQKLDGLDEAQTKKAIYGPGKFRIAKQKSPEAD